MDLVWFLHRYERVWVFSGIFHCDSRSSLSNQGSNLDRRLEARHCGVESQTAKQYLMPRTFYIIYNTWFTLPQGTPSAIWYHPNASKRQLRAVCGDTPIRKYGKPSCPWWTKLLMVTMWHFSPMAWPEAVSGSHSVIAIVGCPCARESASTT